MMVVESPILLAIVLVLLAYFVKIWLKSRRMPPGPLTLPLVGDVGFFSAAVKKRQHHYTRSLHEVYGDLVTTKIAKYTVVFIRGSEMITEAFVRKADYFSDRPNSSMFLDFSNKWSLGIIQSSGQLNKELRKYALTAIRNFAPTKVLEQRVNEEASMLCSEIDRADGEARDFGRLIQNAVSNVVCTIAVGHRYDYDDDDFQRMLQYVERTFRLNRAKRLSNFLPDFLEPLLGRFDSMRTQFENNMTQYFGFFQKEVDEHAKSFDPKNIRDFVDLYLKEKNGSSGVFTEKNIFRSVLDLFLAGTDTTSTTLYWIILYMLHYPEVAAKARQEIDQVVGSSRQPTLADQTHLPYTDAVCHEVMRLSNVAVSSLFHNCNADVQLGAHLIPAGTIVSASIYATHVNGAVWDQPDKFLPDRWLTADGKQLKKFDDFFPFSYGRRICLGDFLAKIEIFLFTATLLQCFDFKPLIDDSTGLPVLPSLEGEQSFIFHPLPYKVSFVRR